MGYSIQSRRIIKRLEKEGWYQKSVDGDHYNYKKNGVEHIVTVVHPQKDYPKGTLRNIFRVAGWEWPPDMSKF